MSHVFQTVDNSSSLEKIIKMSDVISDYDKKRAKLGTFFEPRIENIQNSDFLNNLIKIRLKCD